MTAVQIVVLDSGVRGNVRKVVDAPGRLRERNPKATTTQAPVLSL